jgi:LDH2 family malate/lactate/ureidoglycolate dehydrogenase
MRIPASDLRALAIAILSSVGVPGADADLIAGLLIDTDLRGVLSHGTFQLDRYVRQYLDGRLNRAPQVRIVRNDPATAIVDGDGGLGHLAAARATELAIAKAKALGTGAVVSRNHGHFGSAGKYTRMAVRQGCAGFCVSGHVIEPSTPERPCWNAMGDPPMSFAFPAGDEAPPTLDMSTSMFRQDNYEPLFEQIPSAFYKSIGLVTTSLLLGGALAGMSLPELRRENRAYRAADYGAFVCAWDVEHFVSVEEFRDEVDRTARRLHQLPPLPGYERYELPGGPEWARERAWAVEGIPIGREHQRQLEQAALLAGVPVPWASDSTQA